MRKIFLLQFFLFGFLANIFCQTPSSANPVGIWQNISVSGSILHIKTYDPKKGTITGDYTSPSGAGPKAYPIVGWINNTYFGSGKDTNTVISFTVNWEEWGAITSWTGTIKNDTIKTVWNLSHVISGFSWDHINTQADIFIPKRN